MKSVKCDVDSPVTRDPLLMIDSGRCSPDALVAAT